MPFQEGGRGAKVRGRVVVEAVEVRAGALADLRAGEVTARDQRRPSTKTSIFSWLPSTARADWRTSTSAAWSSQRREPAT